MKQVIINGKILEALCLKYENQYKCSLSLITFNIIPKCPSKYNNTRKWIKYVSKK